MVRIAAVCNGPPVHSGYFGRLGFAVVPAFKMFWLSNRTGFQVTEKIAARCLLLENLACKCGLAERKRKLVKTT